MLDFEYELCSVLIVSRLPGSTVDNLTELSQRSAMSVYT